MASVDVPRHGAGAALHAGSADSIRPRGFWNAGLGSKPWPWPSSWSAGAAAGAGRGDHRRAWRPERRRIFCRKALPGEGRSQTSTLSLSHSRSADAVAPCEPQLWIGRPHAGLRQAQLPAYDVGALDQGHALVERDPPRQALATKAAIGPDDELLLGNIFQGLADQRRHVLRRFDHGIAVVDHADADLLVGLDVLEQMQVLPV